MSLYEIWAAFLMALATTLSILLHLSVSRRRRTLRNTLRKDLGKQISRYLKSGNFRVQKLP